MGQVCGKRENIVVVQYAGQKIGLEVDELMGKFQTVIKPVVAFSSTSGERRFDYLGLGRSSSDSGCAVAGPIDHSTAESKQRKQPDKKIL
jgi:hypothetical protein